MVFSYYLFKPLYSFWWIVLNLLKKRQETVFYCHSLVDLEIWEPVQKYLQPIPIVTDKKTTRKELDKRGYKCRSMPVFPKGVIMCRVSAHKFPCDKVKKIGMMHGAYHFKRITSNKNYHPFTRFFFTSVKDLEIAQQIGVKCGFVAGYPKLDPYINNPPPKIEGKPKVLFTATYDKSGMSAIQRWVDRVKELTDNFEVYVTLHPWMSKHYQDAIRSTPGIFYIEEESNLPYLVKCDVCIVDRSSIIADCCAFDKPMISWSIPVTKRTVNEIEEILKDCSIMVNSFNELIDAISVVLANPADKSEARKRGAKIFFDSLDGKAGMRTACEIGKILPELKQNYTS